LAAVGDMSCNSAAQTTVSKIAAKTPELVLGLGDYSYQLTGDCWLNEIQPIDALTRISFGNHDVVPTSLEYQLTSHFGLSRQYYSFNYQNVHVLVVASEMATDVESDQYNFINADLLQASQNPAITWKVVLIHRPLYTSPGGHGVVPPIRDALHPLFDKYDVDLVLQGHSHSYQRTFPLKYNPANPTSPTITNTNANTYTQYDGEIYYVVGTGGATSDTLTATMPYNAFQADHIFGFLNLAFTNGGYTLTANMYRNDNDAILDSITIKKPIPAPGPTGYFTLTGSNYLDVPSNSALQLTTFTLTTKFQTSYDFPVDNHQIVNKGGQGSEAAGKNMNYGIWMSYDEKIWCGFETSTGSDNILASKLVYNDNNWHYVVCTFDGTVLRLYIDGVQISARTVAAGTIPDNTGNQPLRIGANSLNNPPDAFFIGNVDEIRVYNRAWTAQEVTQAYNSSDPSTVTTSGLVYYNGF
jgi:predicted phosphodiesterase